MIWIKEKQYLACRAQETGSDLFSGREQWASRLLCSEGANAPGAVALLSPEGAVTFRALQKMKTLIICGCFRRVASFKIPLCVKKHFEALRYSSDNVYKHCLQLVKIQLRVTQIKAFQFLCQFLVFCSKLYSDKQGCYCFTSRYLSFFWTLKSGWSHVSALICHFTNSLSVLRVLPVRSNTSFCSLPFVLTPALVSSVMW